MNISRFRSDVPEIKITQVLQFYLGQEISADLPAKYYLKVGDVLLCVVGINESACEVVSVGPSTKLNKVHVTLRKPNT